MIRVNFYFLNLFLKQVLSLFFNDLKKNNSENVSTQKYDFECLLCAQIFKKFYMSQMNPKELVHNTADSV